VPPRPTARLRLSSPTASTLTARAQDRDVDAGFSLAADDYLTKPFSPQELRVRVGAHLAKR
jgi:DNA-binding response OmpR family regulator